MKIFKKKSLNIKTGARGEALAKKHISKKLKYKILETNYRNIIGEIDIIAKHKDIIIFVEVKSKTSLDFGLPSEEVTLKKQDKIRKVALLYLKEKSLVQVNFRFDVVEVLNDEINYIANAF